MLALCIPFRGVNAPGDRFLRHLARQLARLSFFDDPADRPDLVVIGHLAAGPLDNQLLKPRLAKAFRKHPRGRVEPVLEVATAYAKKWTPAAARNLAAAHAIALGATKLVFCDADILHARGAFFVAREKLEERAIMLQRPWLIGEREADLLVVEKLWADLPPAQEYPDDPELQGIYVPGAWFGIPTSLFLAIGGYDETMQRGEDEDICDRAVRAGAARLMHSTLVLHVGAVTDPGTDPLLPEARRVLDFRRDNHVTVIRNPSGRFAGALEDRRRVLPSTAPAGFLGGPSLEA